MRSLGKVLDQHRGIGPGFDFLRIFLAFSIVAVHTLILSGHRQWVDHGPLWFVEVSLVPMFFALSGFLVSASGQRLSLKNFLINRGLRIVPALTVDVVVCALILGPLVTTVPLREYFTDSRFFSYFLNSVGWIHYKLPGVFEYYSDSRVNGALWTVPYEIFCYVLISVLIVTKFIRDARWTGCMTVAYFGSVCVVSLIGVPDFLPGRVQDLLRSLFAGGGARIVTAFLTGILFYQLRYRIPFSRILFGVAAAFCIIVAIFAGGGIGRGVLIQPLLLPSLTYLIAFIGLSRVPIPQFFKTGDYSYGVYLYHDPMIHLINTSFPAIALGTALGGLFTYTLVVPAVIGVAYLSWHLVEKRILAQRKRFSFVARARGVDGDIAPMASLMPAPVTGAVRNDRERQRLDNQPAA